VHIIGLGDYDVEKIEILDDPCPPFKKIDHTNKGKLFEKVLIKFQNFNT